MHWRKHFVGTSESKKYSVNEQGSVDCKSERFIGTRVCLMANSADFEFEWNGQSPMPSSMGII